MIDTGENLHERGFSGAVLAHQGVNFTGAQIKADTAQGVNTRKALFDGAHFDF
jgi:uncharacterized protein YjbI with pentapeptide repeats